MYASAPPEKRFGFFVFGPIFMQYLLHVLITLERTGCINEIEKKPDFYTSVRFEKPDSTTNSLALFRKRFSIVSALQTFVIRTPDLIVLIYQTQHPVEALLDRSIYMLLQIFQTGCLMMQTLRMHIERRHALNGLDIIFLGNALTDNRHCLLRSRFTQTSHRLSSFRSSVHGSAVDPNKGFAPNFPILYAFCMDILI